MVKHSLSLLLLAGVILVVACSTGTSVAQQIVYAKDGSGIYGYKDTPKLPWCEWLCHDPDRPAPVRINPGSAGLPAPVPSDAVVLFDGKDTSKWQPREDWKLQDGFLVAGNSPLTTKDSFGAIQMHVEFMTPAGFEGPMFNRGNNGVFLMGLYEIQIFESYNEKIYPDGQCAAIYGQTPPLVNASRPPGEWQTFDIAFTPPQFEGEKLTSAARVTLFHNGALAHLTAEIYGETGHRIVPEYKRKVSTGPLALGGHGCPVRFRNIWLRRL
jgi:3-keto-disaccharide hydrolase